MLKLGNVLVLAVAFGIFGCVDDDSDVALERVAPSDIGGDEPCAVDTDVRLEPEEPIVAARRHNDGTIDIDACDTSDTSDQIDIEEPLPFEK